MSSKKASFKAKASEKSIAREHSSLLLDGPSRAASRAMLYPVGFTEKDFSKSIVGVA